MAVEVELKVGLDDFAAVKERLFRTGEYCRSFTKADSYWAAQGAAHSAVRVRRESGIKADGAAHGSVLVTYKVKKITGGIEVNQESEFSVSDAALFEELLARLGLYRDICKEKQGWAWTVTPAAGGPPILAELSRVAALGWFLELEITGDDGSRQTVEENKKRLLALLEKLEIPAGRIESRPYAEMLRENERI